MGDGPGQARVGSRPMTWEQEENALIAAAQTGADPEAGAQQLRLIRFANSRSGQQVMENAGAPTEMEAPTETVFLVCSDAGFFAPQRILRGDSLETQQMKAAVLGAHIYSNSALGAGPWPPFLKDGPSSVTLAVVNDFSVGAFRASIRREHKEQFLDCYGTRMGVKVFQTVETPVYALVLPRRSCVTEEFARFASLAGQDVPIGLSLNSRDIGQGKGRYAFMVDFDGCHRWAATAMIQNPLPTWTNGSPMVIVGTGAKPDTLTFVVLGVEGRGGKEALHDYLHRLTGFEPMLTWEPLSVARRGMVNVAVPWTHETERLCHRLTRSAASVEVESPYRTDKVFCMQFSPDADTASFRNGKEVVRGGSGGLQIAQLQQQAGEHKRQLDSPPQGVSQQTPPLATVLRPPGLAEKFDPVLAASTHEEQRASFTPPGAQQLPVHMEAAHGQGASSGEPSTPPEVPRAKQGGLPGTHFAFNMAHGQPRHFSARGGVAGLLTLLAATFVGRGGGRVASGHACEPFARGGTECGFIIRARPRGFAHGPSERRREDGAWVMHVMACGGPQSEKGGPGWKIPENDRFGGEHAITYVIQGGQVVLCCFNSLPRGPRFGNSRFRGFRMNPRNGLRSRLNSSSGVGTRFVTLKLAFMSSFSVTDGRNFGLHDPGSARKSMWPCCLSGLASSCSSAYLGTAWGVEAAHGLCGTGNHALSATCVPGAASCSGDSCVVCFSPQHPNLAATGPGVWDEAHQRRCSYASAGAALLGTRSWCRGGGIRAHGGHSHHRLADLLTEQPKALTLWLCTDRPRSEERRAGLGPSAALRGQA